MVFNKIRIKRYVDTCSNIIKSIFKIKINKIDNKCRNFII